MKARRLDDSSRARIRLVPTQREPARQDGSPPIAERSHPVHEPARCERCDAIYERKTWRAAGPTRPARVPGETHTLCPACRQVDAQEYFGRLLVTRPLTEQRAEEVRRRIWNVERRARYTQPERRLVRIELTPDGLEVLTTSQKLAHRIAHELEKAFGGRARYQWADRERVLDATWDPEAPPLR